MPDVDPAAIRALADEFDAAAATLAAGSGRFGADGHLSPDAFGRLPASGQAFADYAERLQHATGSLQRLEDGLHQFARNLRTIATNWEIADQGGTAG